jgi:hypothetical protein
MKGSTRAAVAIGVGYMLGRRRKLRVATVMAVATAVGGTTVGGMILRRGTKYLSSTDAIGKLAPQAGEIVDVLRNDLISASKAAATAAVNSKVDALTDSLHERAERLRNPGEMVVDDAEDYADDDAEDYADDEPGDLDDLEDDEPEEAPVRRGGRGQSPITRVSQTGRATRSRATRDARAARARR